MLLSYRTRAARGIEHLMAPENRVRADLVLVAGGSDLIGVGLLEKAAPLEVGESAKAQV